MQLIKLHEQGPGAKSSVAHESSGGTDSSKQENLRLKATTHRLEKDLKKAEREKQRALDTAEEAHAECVGLAEQVDALKKANLSRATVSQQPYHEQPGARSGRISPSISHSNNPNTSDSLRSEHSHESPQVIKRQKPAGANKQQTD
jgi:hypothetical protein